MRIQFEQMLTQLNYDLIEMGSMCETSIRQTYEAIRTGDVEKAKEIMENDYKMDQKEREIENLCLKLLLQQQPVAGDLRLVSAALKMITDMERIGDQTADISEVISTAGLPPIIHDLPIEDMAMATIHMVTSSINAYVKKDTKIAKAVVDYDDVVDELFLKTKNVLLEDLAKGKLDGSYAMDMYMIAKYFERIGDHATNIAEWVAFSLTGRHKGE